MLSRNDCEEMWVWNNDIQNPKTEKRIVIEHLPDGACQAVAQSYESKFRSGKGGFDMEHWYFCAPIEAEPQWRAFKDGEMPERYRDYWYRNKGRSTQCGVKGYDPLSCEQLYFYSGWVENNELFEAYEVQINGIWQPVGVCE